MGERNISFKVRIPVPAVKARDFFGSIFRFFFSFEFFFGLFLFAGVFKENPRLGWIPVDLTLIGLGSSFLFGIQILHRSNWKISRSVSSSLIMALVFFLWALLSLKWSNSWAYGGRKALQLFIMGFWGYAGSTLILAPYDRRFLRFCGVIVFFSIWMAFELVGILISDSILTDWDFASNYLGFGRLLGLSVIILVSLLVWGRLRLAGNIGVGILSAFMISILMISGGRGPFLATLAAMVVPIVRDFRLIARGFAVKRNLLILLTLLVLVLVGFVFIGNRYFGFTTIDRILILLEAGGGTSARERLWLFEKAWEGFLQSPIVGHGIGDFGFILGWGDVRVYPHNIVLEILVELGLVGFGLFVGMVFSSLKRVSVAWIRKDMIAAMVLMFFINSTVNASVSGDMPDNRMFFAFLGLCAGRYSH